MAAPVVESFAVGDAVLVLHKNTKWYPAKILRKRVREEGEGEEAHVVTEVQYKWDGRKPPKSGQWLAVTDHGLRPEPTAETSDEVYLAEMRRVHGRVDGHIGGQQFTAEKIVDVRGEGDDKRFRVRWVGWPPETDTWEPEDHIEDGTLIDDFEAEQEAARLEAEAAARRERARHAELFLDAVEDKLQLKLLKTKEVKDVHEFMHVDRCDADAFEALRELALSHVPETEDPSEHVSEIEQYVGASGRSKTIGYEFHVKTPLALGGLLHFEDVVHDDVCGFENIKFGTARQGPGTAVAMLPPLSFRRRGPRRGRKYRMALVAKAAFGALPARELGFAIWGFKGCTDAEEKRHKRAMSNRLLELNHRRPGVLPQSILKTCRRDVNAA